MPPTPMIPLGELVARAMRPVRPSTHRGTMVKSVAAPAVFRKFLRLIPWLSIRLRLDLGDQSVLRRGLRHCTLMPPPSDLGGDAAPVRRRSSHRAGRYRLAVEPRLHVIASSTRRRSVFQSRALEQRLLLVGDLYEPAASVGFVECRPYRCPPGYPRTAIRAPSRAAR